METRAIIHPMIGADGLKLRPETLQRTSTEHAPLNALHIAIDDPQTRDEQLDRAVNAIIPTALERRQGILVTKHDPESYTVYVDASVPCGSILEKSLC